MLLPIVFILAIALTAWFVICTDAGVLTKIIVGSLFVASMLLRFSRFSMAGFFLQTGLCIFLAIYHKVKSV